MTVLLVLSHWVPFGVCVWRYALPQNANINMTPGICSVLLLSAVIMIYEAIDAWPYVLSAIDVVVWGALMIACHTRYLQIRET